MKKHLLLMIGFCLSFISQDLIAQNSVEVTAFRDMNGNGLDDDFAFVPTLSTTQLFLQEAGGMVYNHVETAAGVYTFDESGAGLPDGTYTLNYIETPWTPAAVNMGSEVMAITQLTGDNDVDPITGISAPFVLVGGSQSVTDVDLGLYFVTAIGDFVWEDINGDGLQDGELGNGIDGVTVTLLDGTGATALDTDNNLVPASVTAGGGDYQFGNLPPGDYIVQFSLPTAGGATWYATTYNPGMFANDSDADPNNSFQTSVFTIDADIIYNDQKDAGFFQAANIGNMVWEDLNGDGVQDGGEPGLDGVTVTLFDVNTGAQAIGADGLLIAAQNTAGGGFYEFMLVAPGEYQVEFGMPAPIGGVNWYPTEFTMHTDATDLDTDSDANNDATSPDYLRSHNIVIESGETDEETRIDAGFWLPSKIGNKVFCDENGDGIDNDGVGGVDDIDVTLLNDDGSPAVDADGMPQTDKTNSGGMYEFDLVPPGNYIVEFSFPGAPGPADPPFKFTIQDQGGNESTDSDVDPAAGGTQGQTPIIEVTSQDMDEEMIWSAGVYQLITIAGTIWYDDNMDNMLDGTEAGPAGILVNLYNADDGSKIDDVLTTAGNYEFPSTPGIELTPGNYFVEIDATAFTGVLTGAEACGVGNNADDMVDNDDNGNGAIPAQSTPFTVLSNCDPATPPVVEYVDFCYFFNCNTPNDLAFTACDQITDPDIICDINTLASFCAIMPSVDSPGNQPDALCQNVDNGSTGGVAHNISWFAFVAYGGSYSVVVTPTNCSGGAQGNEGVQLGLYTDCTFSQAVYCEPGCSIDPVSFDSDILEEGQTYYFFIDGCAGSVCSYEVEITGTPLPPNLTPTDLCIDNGGVIECTDGMIYCPDAVIDFVVQGVELTVDHEWSIIKTDGGTYNGDPFPMTEEGELSVSFDEEGEYTICINNINNGCQNWSGSVCRTIIVAGLDDEEFDTQLLCDIADFDVNSLMNASATNPADPNGDATEGWQENSTTFVIGTNTAMITTAQGCEYEQEVELQLHPVSDVGLVDMTLCIDDLMTGIDINGIIYDENSFAGNLELSIPSLVLPGQDVNGCDSIYDIELEVLDIGGLITELETQDCLPEGIPLNFLFDETLSTDEQFFTYTWLDPNGDELPDTYDIPAGNPLRDNIAPFGVNGTYTLVVTIDKDGVQCEFTYTIDVDFDSQLPDIPTIEGMPLVICESDSIQTYTATNLTNNVVNFNWTIPAGAEIVSGGDLFDNFIEVNWAGTTGGSIELVVSNLCGDSDPADALDITLVPLLVPDFTVTQTVCQDSSSVIMYSGPTDDIDSYIWDFGGGVVNNATGNMGPGPHEVSWPVGGSDYTVTLTVLHNGGCTSTETSQVVTVIEPLMPPVVNCNPNTGEVSFSWDPVTGATGYDVVVTSTDTNGDLHVGTLDGTTFTVTGLENGETVNIELIILTGDACVMVTGSAPGCTSQNCTAPTITLDAGNGPGELVSLCTADITGTFDLSSTIVSGEQGTGEYSGPGIIDPVAGTFDPSQANIGINNITYVFMTDDIVPCIGNQSIQIEIIETPVASFLTSADTICITESVSLTYDGTAGVNDASYTTTDGQTFNTAEPTITFTQEGLQTITLSVIKDGCESSTVERTVFVQPELEPIVVSCSIQDLNMVEFSWNDVVGATGYEVVVTDENGTVEPAFTTTSTTFQRAGLSPGDIITITVTVLTDNRCGGSSFTQPCEATACPTFTFTYDNEEIDLCVSSDGSTSPITLQALASGGDGTGTYTWAGSPNISGDQFDPNGLPEGAYDLIVTYSENGCEDNGGVTVNITHDPTASFDITVDPVCIGSTEAITFTGSNLPNQTLDWSASDVIVSGSGTDYSATFDAEGTFDIVLNMTNGDNDQCVAGPVTATVTVEPELVFGDIDCNPSLDQITFTWATVDCATEYEVFIDNVSQGTQTGTDFTATGLTDGQEVEIQVIAVSGCACGNVMNTMLCEARPCVSVDLTVSAMGGVTDFCFAEDLATVDVLAEIMNNTSDGSGVYSGTGVDPVSGTFDPIAAGIGSHTIIYTWIEPEGCNDFVDSVTFNIFENPELTVISDPIDCYQDSMTTLTLTAINGDGNYTFSSGGLDIPMTSEVNAGTYDVIVTDGNGCVAEASETVSIPAEPMPSIAGSDELITGDSSSYSIEQSIFTGLAIDSIVWTANGVVICDDVSCFDLGSQTPTENTTYMVSVFYNDGCSVFTSLDVVVTDPDPIFTVDIPNIISPNGDGVNDKWTIFTGDPEVVVSSIRIMDRWGNLVYELTDPYNPAEDASAEIGWDGKFGTADLQPGVFVYSVVYTQDGRERVRNGDVTIVDVK